MYKLTCNFINILSSCCLSVALAMGIKCKNYFKTYIYKNIYNTTPMKANVERRNVKTKNNNNKKISVLR